MKRVFFFDIETLSIFTATFLDRDSDEIRQFVITKTKDERKELFHFLENQVAGLIGYNSIFFDANIIEYMYRYPDCTVQDIKRYAAIITSENNRKPDVPEWKLRHKHLDLYKIHHFDNKNRGVSLKWCEFGMDLDNIEDLPSDGEGDTWEEQVLSYNLNDVLATKALYERSLKEVELRKELTKLYGINFMNSSNSRIGSELCLKLYCDATGKYKSDVRSQRTVRKYVNVEEIIFPYITFKSNEFNNVLSKFKSLTVSSAKGEIEFTQIYKGFQFDYGAGGIHGSINNRIVSATEEYKIIDVDVASLYPSIAIANKLYPEHLGEEFYQVYHHDIVAVRLAEKAKKDKGNKAIVDGFKEAANAVYGRDKFIFY